MATDGFGESDQVSFLMKKYFGAPCTSASKVYYQEPIINSRQSILPSQIMSQTIPTVAPTDFAVNTDVSGLWDSRLVSAGNPYIVQYVKVQLASVYNGTNYSYTYAGDLTLNPLRGAISFNFDPLGSYDYKIYRHDKSTVIVNGEGSWVLDNDAGILTFFATLSYVTQASPPFVNLIRYEGTRGITGGGSSQWVTSSSNISYTEGNVAIGLVNPGIYALDVSGDIHANNVYVTNSTQVLSDYRLKTDITPMSSVSERMLKLRGYTYMWNMDEFRRSGQVVPQARENGLAEVGFMAQEVEAQFPEVVHTGPNGYKTIMYDRMVPMLLETVKEQQMLINALEKRMTNLEVGV